MALVLVEALPDVASVGIASALRSRPGWSSTGETFEGRDVYRFSDSPTVRLVTIDRPHIHAEALDEALRSAGIEPDMIVFLSKHKSEAGRPALTVHPLGNYRDAALGGQPGRLTPVPAAAFTHMLRALASARTSANFPAEVTFEVTHHGPLLETPAFFVELGSTEPHWEDPAGHDVLAAAVTRFLTTTPDPYPIVIGLGGGHYGPRFTDASLTKEIHFAHLLPTYHAEHIAAPDVVVKELKRASPGATGFYYHDGTLKKEKRDLWFQAFEAQGVARQESRTWPRSRAFDKSTNNALSD